MAHEAELVELGLFLFGAGLGMVTGLVTPRMGIVAIHRSFVSFVVER